MLLLESVSGSEKNQCSFKDAVRRRSADMWKLYFLRRLVELVRTFNAGAICPTFEMLCYTNCLDMSSLRAAPRCKKSLHGPHEPQTSFQSYADTEASTKKMQSSQLRGKKRLQLYFSDRPALRLPVPCEKLCDYIVLNTPLNKFFSYRLKFVKKRRHSLTLFCQAFCQHRYCLFMPLLPLSQIRYCLSRHIQCKFGINSTLCSLVCLTEMELCVSTQSELSC